MPAVNDALSRLNALQNLTQDEMTTLIDAVMRGACSEDQITCFLTDLNEKGETIAEVAGAAVAMRRHMVPIRHARQGVIDTCGTGGDGSRTFNISTAAALVTAAAGVPVAKHGNRSITSRTGSADVLAELGVNVEASVAVVERCLNELGICFCFAPHLHPAMKHVAQVRRRLGFPTIFNLLGPLCNPAGAPFQLLGVGKPKMQPLIASALALLGPTRAVVVCGADGLDEVTLSGPTNVREVVGNHVREFCWTPADFGLSEAGRESMLVDGPAASAAIIREILAGASGPPREIVVLNAAAALWTAEKDATPAACAARAAQAIDDGSAKRLLEQWAAMTR